MKKNELKMRLMAIRAGDFITPLLEELWELIKPKEYISDVPHNKSHRVYSDGKTLMFDNQCQRCNSLKK